MDMHRIIIIVIIWNLWLERNRILFMDRVYSMEHYIFCITNDMFLWITAFRESRTTPHTTQCRSYTPENPRPPPGTTDPDIGTEEAAHDGREYKEQGQWLPTVCTLDCRGGIYLSVFMVLYFVLNSVAINFCLWMGIYTFLFFSSFQFICKFC